MTGKRGPVAVLAIGVRQQSAYQRKTLVGEAQAAHGIRACDELHPGGRHLEDVRSAGRVEHVRPLEETRECLAVPAIADEAELDWGTSRMRPHRQRRGRSKGMRCTKRDGYAGGASAIDSMDM
jgi:hypothetical protein